MIALAAAKGMFAKAFDVETAFLYGILKEVIYMKPPEGYITDSVNTICRLNKSLYGLKQAPRCWSEHFQAFLKRYNLKPIESDPCIYTGTFEGESVYLLMYVDDGLVFCRNQDILNNILDTIGSVFKIKTSDANAYLGFEISQTHTGSIMLTQKGYTRAFLEKYNMTECKPTSVPMLTNLDLVPASESDTRYPFRQFIGGGMYLVQVSRPDLAFAVSKLSQFTTCFDETHWKCAKVLLRYLAKTIDWGIEYKPS